MSTKDLKLKAEEIDPDIEDLSNRQFNARYPLQVKRELSAEQKDEEKRDESASETAEGDELRPVVRQTLIDFARAVAGAENAAEVIDVLEDVDAYVDRVVEGS